VGEGVGGPCESGGFLVWPNRFRCMRDVKEEEHPLVHLLSAFVRANDEFDQRERSEGPPVTDVSVLMCGWCCWAS